MQKPPLLLERLFFAEVNVKASAAALTEPWKGQVQTSVGLFENAKEERAWQARVEIRVSSAEERQIPYEINLVAFGQFTVTEEKVDRARAMQLVAITGASIIYSAAREYLMILTGRGPWGAFQLPTVSLADVKIAAEGQDTAAVIPAQARPKRRRRGARGRATK